MSPCRRPLGHTLLELLVVLLILAILTTRATISLLRAVEHVRARAALDQLKGDFFAARMLAVQEGRTVTLVLHGDERGCITRYRFGVADQPAVSTTRTLERHPDLCLRHSGDSILSLNSRGMLRPPARSFSVTRGAFADSVVVSVSGRVRRSYRRTGRARNYCRVRQHLPPRFRVDFL